MKKRKTNHENFQPRHPGFFTLAELGIWLGVSRNSVADIAMRFGIRAIEGRFPETAVYRKILGIDPRDDQDREQLRRPLASVRWLSRKTGVPASTIRARVRTGKFGYPLGVQLSEPSEGGAKPRSRRWIPCVIDALAEGKEPPNFVVIVGKPAKVSAEIRTDADDPSVSNNVFARIAHSNDQAASK